jgi:riboflavin transporter 2
LKVHELPEGWRLPSILSASTQIAQIAPIIFVLGRWFFPSQFTYVRAIYLILGVGALSCLLLSFFWKKTAIVFGEEHSIGLILLNFSLALLGKTV